MQVKETPSNTAQAGSHVPDVCRYWYVPPTLEEGRIGGVKLCKVYLWFMKVILRGNHNQEFSKTAVVSFEVVVERLRPGTAPTQTTGIWVRVYTSFVIMLK